MLDNSDPTNGWDAVLALHHTEINALFFQQYLEAGPGNPLAGRRLRVALSVGEGDTFWILDALLGAPNWIFPADAVQATLVMELIKGSLIAFNPAACSIEHVSHLQPNESALSGSLELTKVDSTVSTLGAVAADLGASAYAPVIVGVEAESMLNTEIGNAVAAYFKYNDTLIPLGAIAPGQVPSLMPTEFRFAIQLKPSAQDACVLLLIKTSGPGGEVGPLAKYPIPDKKTAALLISARALFAGILPESMNSVFSGAGARFSGSVEGGRGVTTCSDGAISLGQINKAVWETDHDAWSSDGSHQEAPVKIGLNGFTLVHSGNQIAAHWTCTQRQTWSKYLCSTYSPGNPSVCCPNAFNASIQVDYAQTFDVEMSPGNDSVVAFTAENAGLNVSFTDGPDWMMSWLGVDVSKEVHQRVAECLKSVFSNFTIPSIQTFTLTSLLFPVKHAVHLTEVTLPGGLALAGALSQPFAVTPSRTQVAPGQSVQFGVAGKPASDFTWEIKPKIGTMIDGLYQAPATAASAEVVVVSAVSNANLDLKSSAMVVIAPNRTAGGLTVTPASALVTPGHRVKLSTADARKKPLAALAVEWTLSPDIGKIEAAFQHGAYTFIAPATLSVATEVTATAVNPADRTQVGHVVIQLVPSTVIAVTPEHATVKVKETLELASSVKPEDAEDLCWVVYPAGAGKVEPHPGDHARATYTAPADLARATDVFVAAYSVTDQNAGLGLTRITLTL